MKTEIMKKICALHRGKLRQSGGAYHRLKKTLELEFVSDVAPAAGLEDEIQEIVSEYLPAGATCSSVRVRKVIAQSDLVASAAYSFVAATYAPIVGQISKSDFKSETDGDKITLNVMCESSVKKYLESCGDANEKIKRFLETQFVNDFTVILQDAGERAPDEKALTRGVMERQTKLISRRTFKVDSVQRLFDSDATSEAVYIADCDSYIGNVYLAGKVVAIVEKKTKKDKPYFSIDIDDQTGRVSGLIFPNKDKEDKIRKILAGAEIIVHGEFYISDKGYHNLRINSINLCCLPKNFVPVRRAGREAAADYNLVFPEKLVVESQVNLFDNPETPECFLNRTLVAFDLETTGVTGDDKITEIGAVKIVDGQFTEYFETLVNPEKHIPDDIVELTGISDETVANAPVFEQICSDFYKFCDGAILVAHNASFDLSFIRRQGQAIDYYFDNPSVDTLALSRECITGVSSHKLNVLCDKFGIHFNHHRAYSDALACAKLLFEIVKIRKTFL